MQHRLPRSWRAIAQMRQLPRRLAFLPQASWPVYALQSLEISSGHPLDHAGLYSAIRANRATGLSDTALRDEMTARLWNNSGQDIMRSVHFQLAFLFTKLRAAEAQPSMSSTLDFFSLLNKGDRLVSKAFSTASASYYGMGRYTSNSVTNHELLYMLGSKIIGQDLRKLFDMYGLPLSDATLGSVADLGLPVASRQFYALPAGKHNQLASGQWLDIESSLPNWPY